MSVAKSIEDSVSVGGRPGGDEGLEVQSFQSADGNQLAATGAAFRSTGDGLSLGFLLAQGCLGEGLGNVEEDEDGFREGDRFGRIDERELESLVARPERE